MYRHQSRTRLSENRLWSISSFNVLLLRCKINFGVVLPDGANFQKYLNLKQ